MSVMINAETFDAPQILFERPDIRTARSTGVLNYDIAEDGERFLMVVASDTSTQFHIVLNWFDELERLIPADR